MSTSKNLLSILLLFIRPIFEQKKIIGKTSYTPFSNVVIVRLLDTCFLCVADIRIVFKSIRASNKRNRQSNHFTNNNINGSDSRVTTIYNPHLYIPHLNELVAVYRCRDSSTNHHPKKPQTHPIRISIRIKHFTFR